MDSASSKSFSKSHAPSRVLRLMDRPWSQPAQLALACAHSGHHQQKESSLSARTLQTRRSEHRLPAPPELTETHAGRVYRFAGPYTIAGRFDRDLHAFQSFVADSRARTKRLRRLQTALTWLLALGTVIQRTSSPHNIAPGFGFSRVGLCRGLQIQHELCNMHELNVALHYQQCRDLQSKALVEAIPS